jgi:hypothetical protein
MKDTTVNTINAQAHLLEDDGRPVAVQLMLVAGTALPLAPGPGQPPIMMPTEVFRFPLSKQAAKEFAQQINEAAEQLPNETDLAIATSLQGVDQLADATQRFTNGR